MEVKIPTDEKIARKVESLTRILLFPLFLLFQIRHLHFASVFNTPWRRRLQTAAISCTIFIFLVGAQISFGISVGLLLFSKYWLFIAIYLTHYFLDADKPENGGRPIAWVRNNAFWRYARDYFPIITIKDEDCNMKPNENYLIGFHPHGVLSLSSILSFAANQCDFQELFPGMDSYMCALPVWFQVPFFREFLMAGGLIPSSRKGIKYQLQRPDGGNVVALIVGGAPESLMARPGDVRLFLKKRYGFIKIALQEGCSVVPTFAFGEHQLFIQDENPKGSAMRWFQDTIQNYTGGITFPSFHGRGVLQYDFGMVPFRKPVYVVVGKPLNFGKIENPNHEEISRFHELYIEELRSLFEKYKGRYASSSMELIIE